ncbi:hypothetical protein ACEQ8H_004452 [Pleosporales sp. CAS-2024a]
MARSTALDNDNIHPCEKARVPHTNPVKEGLSAMTDAQYKSVDLDSDTSRNATAPQHGIVDNVVRCLEDVSEQMNRFDAYITSQKESSKPLYHWERYGEYPALRREVTKLQKAMATFQPGLLSPEDLAANVSRAIHCSTFVSNTTVRALGIMHAMTTEYMDDMESSTLSEDAEARANNLITKEVQEVLKHCTLAAEQVWRATDLLRGRTEKRALVPEWSWSAAATAMTALIAAVVAIFATHLYGTPGACVGAAGGRNPNMYHAALDLIERNQALTNLTSSMYSMKLQDMEQRYVDLATTSASYGMRIDNIVEGLGPPNTEGKYYPTTQENDNPCWEKRFTQVSQDLALQLKRQKEAMQLMRKDMLRMDIRLTSDVDKLKKKKK